jgi:hypothetical protein
MELWLRLDACPVAQRSTAHQRSTTITTVLARRLPWCRRDLLTATGETAHRSVSTSDSWFVARACAPKVSVLSMISDMRKVWLRGRATARRSPCFSRVRGRRWVASSGIFRQVYRLGDDTQRGEPWGEQGLARGVPPLLHPVQCQSRVVVSRLDAPSVCSELQSSPRLSARGLRAALCAARTNSTSPARR